MMDALVLGTGPYGLAAAAAARSAGMDVAWVGGEIFETWKRMPEGMRLRTDARSSTIHHPDAGYAFPDFARASVRDFESGVALRREDVIAYGEWYAARAGLSPQGGRVTGVEMEGSTLRATVESLADTTQSQVSTRNIVVAVGLAWNPTIPAPIRDGLPDSRYTHTSGIRRFDERFKERRILVIGAGQSALEAVEGLLRAGAEVVHVYPGSAVRFKSVAKNLPEWALRIGSRFSSHWCHAPDGLRHWYRGRKHDPNVEPYLARCLERTRAIPGNRVVEASPRGPACQIRLGDGVEFEVDHVVLGTGFSYPVGGLDFLSGLLPKIEQRHGYPVLGSAFESTVPGLHFVGALSEFSHGPAHRFLFGTRPMARGLMRSLLASRRNAGG